eukprot:6482215-Amphidinium_carterae.1
MATAHAHTHTVELSSITFPDRYKCSQVGNNSASTTALISKPGKRTILQGLKTFNPVGAASGFVSFLQFLRKDISMIWVRTSAKLAMSNRVAAKATREYPSCVSYYVASWPPPDAFPGHSN